MAQIRADSVAYKPSPVLAMVDRLTIRIEHPHVGNGFRIKNRNRPNFQCRVVAMDNSLGFERGALIEFNAEPGAYEVEEAWYQAVEMLEGVYTDYRIEKLRERRGKKL